MLECIEQHDHRQDDNRPEHQVATCWVQVGLRNVFRTLGVRHDEYVAYILHVAAVKCHDEKTSGLYFKNKSGYPWA